MKKIFSFVLLFLLLFIITGCSKQTTTAQNYNLNKTNQAETSKTNNDINNYPMFSAETVADKLMVYYFHKTSRCYSCKTIGKYVKETIEQKYNKQTSDGTIDYREINIDLAENKEIAKKYQASGSSLFINRIINEVDNIEQDINVWQLIGDEVKFKSYLENKINSYLGM